MEKTKYEPHKLRFVVAIIIPVSMVLLSVGLFVKKFNHEIEFTQKELAGVHEVQSYYQHLNLAQEIRALRQLQIGGFPGLEQRIEKLQKRLENTLRISEQEPHANWHNVRLELNGLNTGIKQMFAVKDTRPDSLKLFDRYSRFNLELIVLLKRVADSSNLTLDPEQDSHLLEELVVDRLPLIIEHIAMLRGLMAYVAQRPEQFATVIPRLQYRLHTLSDECTIIKVRYESLMHSNASIARVKPGIDRLLVSTGAYMDYVQKAITKKQNFASPVQMLEHGSTALNIASKLAGKVNSELIEELHRRKKELTSVKNKIISWISLATLFFISIVLIYFRGNRKTYERLIMTKTALASAQSRNTVIINTVVDGIISIDSRGIVKDFNPSAERIFGYRSDEVIGRNINMLMPEPYSIEHDDYLHNFLTTGHKKIIGMSREVEGRRKDASVFPMDLAVNEMQIDGEHFFTGIVRDITDRRRVEMMKNEFISTVSHELRTPLTSIRGSLGLVSGGAVGEVSEKVKELLTIAGNNTERLLVLINDILDLQKIESGKMSFKFKIVDIMPLVERAIRDNDTYAAQYDVAFEIVQHDDELRVFADKDRLMQVITNLLSNATKFSPAGSKVQISVTQHEGKIRVSITDHGAGIPEDFRHRIFEKFSQSDASDTKTKGGTGLGLSISKLIVEKHGGCINYLSEAGTGTTFYFELPELAGKAIPNKTATHEEFKEHTACILIVEDDPDVADLLHRMLAEAGYDSDVAYTASEARRLLKENIDHYQVMTLDITLTGEDGLSLLRSLRDDPKTRALPVVVVSGKADEGKIELNGGAVGILDWLNKPIDQARLIHAIEQVAGANYLPRVLHVEDDEDVHKIVALMLQGSCELVWASTVEASRQVLEEERVDLVLLDIELPDGSGLELLESIEHHVRPPRIVIFSANEVAAEYVSRVNAILKKSISNNDELLKTIVGFMKR